MLVAKGRKKEKKITTRTVVVLCKPKVKVTKSIIFSIYLNSVF
jgi:hypothetical protein